MYSLKIIRQCNTEWNIIYLENCVTQKKITMDNNSNGAAWCGEIHQNLINSNKSANEFDDHTG